MVINILNLYFSSSVIAFMVLAASVLSLKDIIEERREKLGYIPKKEKKHYRLLLICFVPIVRVIIIVWIWVLAFGSDEALRKIYKIE